MGRATALMRQQVADRRGSSAASAGEAAALTERSCMRFCFRLQLFANTCLNGLTS